jgi:hypothetical protein
LLRVPTAEFHRNIEHYQDVAQREPLALVDGDAARCVVLSAEEYGRLKRRDQRVITVEEMTDEDLKLIENARMPVGYEHLDLELDGWTL